jgi:hypothetical protein
LNALEPPLGEGPPKAKAYITEDVVVEEALGHIQPAPDGVVVWLPSRPHISGPGLD